MFYELQEKIISSLAHYSGTKPPKRDSSKRKSKTFLYSNKFSGDSLLGKTLPRQGAFRMAAPLSERYIAGSTFTVCIKLNKKSLKFIEHVN